MDTHFSLWKRSLWTSHLLSYWPPWDTTCQALYCLVLDSVRTTSWLLITIRTWSHGWRFISCSRRWRNFREFIPCWNRRNCHIFARLSCCFICTDSCPAITLWMKSISSWRSYLGSCRLAGQTPSKDSEWPRQTSWPVSKGCRI